MPSARNRKSAPTATPKQHRSRVNYSDFDSDTNVKEEDDGELDAIIDKREIEELRKNEVPIAENAIKQPITWQKMATRSITASLMAVLYLCILYAGHFYCILAVAILQAEMYREIVNVRYVEAKERAMPGFRTIQWLWFSVSMIFVYGESFHTFCQESSTLNSLVWLTRNFSYFGYIMYWILFVASVLTLRPGLIRFQLSQHFWSIITICIVVLQIKYFPDNTLKGIFWYFFPMSMVIMNDVSAYFVGSFVGKKFIQAPFLQLSPNKTWEGFIGAFFCTVIFSFFFSGFLAQFSWYTCPAKTISAWPFQDPLDCTPNPVFIATNYNLPLIGIVRLFPIQWHGLAYGLFASVVAPFGGFFASALKRAYRKKDFDSFFPGHGGVMDRMDCQLLMITFSSFYYRHFIAPLAVDGVEKLLLMASQLSPDDQLVLLKELGMKLRVSVGAT